MHGNEVTCSPPKGGVGDIPDRVYNSYCGVYGIYTIIEKFDGEMTKDFVFPGVGSNYAFTNWKSY